MSITSHSYKLRTVTAVLLILISSGYFADRYFSDDCIKDIESIKVSRNISTERFAFHGRRLNGASLSGTDGQTTRIHGVQIDGTRIKVVKQDGTFLSDGDLTGAILVAADERGITERFRIDSMEKYSSDQTGEIYLYTFSVLEESTGEWKNFCKPDREGRQRGFPLSGYWDSQGNHIPSETEYSIICTSGTIGKCVLFGYLPWKRDREGRSLWEYHQTCSRLFRADYCGNGRPHTRDGTLIEVYDRLGVQVDTSLPGLSFEAAWNEHGAVCLRKTRIPEIAILEDIEKECPEKLGGKTGEENCKESFDDPSVLILNRSPIALNP